jgi:hypothetical protein
MNSQNDLGAETEPVSLERMLNNHKVSDEQIIQTLVTEYFEQAYQFALQRQSKPLQARQAVCRALAQVVNQRQSYWGEPPLEDWLHELVNHLLTIQKKSGLGLPVDVETGNSEDISPQTAVEQALVELRRSARRSGQVRRGLFSVSGLALVVLLLWLAGINQLFSMPGPYSRMRFTYPYITQRGDTLESIAKKAGIKISDVPANQDETLTEPLSPGITLLLPSLKPGFWQTLFPRRADSSPPPLTFNSTPVEIKQRILDSPRYWQSLWADRIIMSYGPSGYIAPPFFANRQQIWLRQPGQGLLLVGGVRGSLILQATYFDGNRVYQTPPDPSGAISTLFLGDANEQERRSLAADMSFLPYFSTTDWEVRPVGIETVARRETLVVDQTNADSLRIARLWVDTHTGVILAQRLYAESYNGTDHQPVLSDQVVMTIQFEVKIPEAMLDPNHRLITFVKDGKGIPLDTPNLVKPAALRFAPDPASIPIDYKPPPAGFNADQSRLTLRLKPLPVDDPFDTDVLVDSRSEYFRKIDVFGDDYYLGTFSLPKAGWMYLDFCRRSPDGSLVIFDQLAAEHLAYWFRLSNPNEVFPLPDAQKSPSQYAISPSSQLLAYYRCDANMIWCGVNLLDFATGQVSRFLETPGQVVNWIGYSPDGRNLALIFQAQGGYSSYTIDMLKIYNLSDAKITYSGPFNPGTGKAASDAPTQAWGAAFQPFANWAKGCDAP